MGIQSDQGQVSAIAQWAERKHWGSVGGDEGLGGWGAKESGQMWVPLVAMGFRS